MTILTLQQTSLQVYRIRDDFDNAIIGYSLTPVLCWVSDRITQLNADVDCINQLQVHVFGTHSEARAFQEGLLMAGDDEARFSPCQCALGWAVLRQLTLSQEDRGHSDILVFLCSAKPRVLVAIRAGQPLVLADPDVDVHVNTNAGTVASSIPDRFLNLLAPGMFVPSINNPRETSESARVH